MSTHYFHKHISPVSTRAFRQLLIAAASCLMVGSSMTACAAIPVYNPDNLGAAQFTRVSDICQTVMGLKPTEPLAGGDWLGEPRLDYYTSHYRVCIVSLSDSLQRAADVQMTKQADADCRAKGYASNSSDLALCVLQAVNSSPQPAATEAALVAPAQPGKLPVAEGSFFRASVHETARRMQLACAALGLEPSQGAFEGCVRRMDHAMYAIDNPIT